MNILTLNTSLKVHYQKKPRSYHLTPRRKKVGKAVARGSKKAVIRECMKDPAMHKYTIQVVGQCVRQELASLCSESVKSVYTPRTIFGCYVYFFMG